MAPPTLFPNLAEVFPTLLRYELIMSLVVLLWRAGGTFVRPYKPPTMNEQTYDGPIVADNFSVNIVIPYLSTFSRGFADPPPRCLMTIFYVSSRWAGMLALGMDPSNPAEN